MSDLESTLQNALAAVRGGRFDEADQSLSASLLTYTDPDERDLILQQLQQLNSHPQNRNIEMAQAFMNMREAQQPLAHVALSQAYFQLHIRSDLRAAQHWAEKAKERAQAEEDWCTLYSASAVIGIVAADTNNRATVISALETMESLVGKDEFISYGDAVLLLEAAAKDGDEAATKARQLAVRLAPLIDDEDFRARAEAISGV